MASLSGVYCRSLSSVGRARTTRLRFGAVRCRSEPTTSSPGDLSDLQPSVDGWRPTTEAVRSSPAASSRTTMLKANRSVRFLRQEGRRASGRGGERLAAFASAVALLTLAWYGQDIISQLGQLMSLPVNEIDGAIYFIICFNVVSLVLPRSRYDF